MNNRLDQLILYLLLVKKFQVYHSLWFSNIRGRFLIFCLCATLLTAPALSGQSIYFRHYQVENGLSNNSVFCSILDRNGFLWLGTKDGLDCFNGFNFKEYRSGNGSRDLKDSYIRCLYLDTTSNRDILFVGTRIGVFRFDPLKETFDFILKTNGEVDGIVKDGYGHLWIIANKRVVCLDLKKKTLITVPATNQLEATAICKTFDDKVWIATANGTIHQVTNQMQRFRLKSFSLFNDSSHLNPRWIERIYPLKNGKILIGTSSFGAKLFDPKTATVSSLITYNREKNGIFARDFKEINDSVIWIASESGIYIYNLINGHFQNLTQKPGDAYSLSDNAVYTLSVDKEGGVWAGTYSGGLNYWANTYTDFKKYYSGESGEGSISGNVVREICQDKYGNLWIGTEDGGLNRLNTRTGQIQHFNASSRPYDISYPNIHALLTYGDTLLVGTFEHGLDIMDIRTGKVTGHFPDKSKSPDKIQKLKSTFIVSLCRTANGSIYAGTRLGLYRFYPKGDKNGQHFQQIIPSLAGAFIHTLMVDSRQNIWIGTMGSGLYCFDPNTMKVSKYLHQPNNKTSISNNWITTVFEDRQKQIWVGTEGGGLCLMNDHGEGLPSFKRFTVKEGLPSNTIYKIIQDENGLLWMTTSRGLLCWNKQTGRKEIFTTSNGLLSDQFNYNSGFKDAKGRLYFGCVKGMISFYPNSFKVSKFTAPLYITSLKTDGEEITNWNQLLNARISVNSNGHSFPHYIEIPHKKASITIEFAALSYTAPEMIRYQYKLDGLDKDWTLLNSNRKVYFTNLSPGDYTFRLKSTNVSGVWNQKEAVLYLKILPTFWESNLAKVLYALIAFSMIAFLFRSYHDRIKEKNKRLMEHMAYLKEKELYEAKINFFTHVTHEIKTPLTLIKAPLEKIIKQIERYPTIEKYILMIQRNATRLLGLSAQLLDFRSTEVAGYKLNLEIIDLKAIIIEIQPDFKELARQNHIKLKLFLPEHEVFIKADKEAITKILTNLLDNGIKYADTKIEAHLEIDDKDNNIVFYTINDGPLILPKDTERIFEPFIRTDTAKSSSGAGLGLALCRTLVKLHHGTLNVSNLGRGLNEFILTLPIDDQHK